MFLPRIFQISDSSTVLETTPEFESGEDARTPSPRFASGAEMMFFSALNRDGPSRMAAGNDPQRLVQAGTELGSLRLHDEALKCFEKLVKKKPDDPVANFLMGTAQNSCNKPGAAETSFKRCISLNSAFYPAYLSLSQLKKQRDSSNHLDSLKKRLKESNGDPAASRFLNFALAKELDDLGRSDESFACLSVANDVVRLAQPYDHSIEQDTFEKVVACYTKLKARGVTGNDSSAPVFIVGMPRSGTTLVERVLAASDSVYAGGELHDFIGQFVYQYGLLPERQNLPAIFGKAHQFDYRKIHDKDNFSYVFCQIYFLHNNFEE